MSDEIYLYSISTVRCGHVFYGAGLVNAGSDTPKTAEEYIIDRHLRDWPLSDGNTHHKQTVNVVTDDIINMLTGVPGLRARIIAALAESEEADNAGQL